MSSKPAEEPKTPVQTKPEDSKQNDQAQGPADNKVESDLQIDNLPEYIEKEISNDKKIENDHQTVLVVANYLDKNPETAQYYDYLVDWRSTNDGSSENFHAKFRLKQQYRRTVSQQQFRDVSPARYVVETQQVGVQPYRAAYNNNRESYGGYYYEKENLGPVGEKYYSEPVEYEYVVEQRQAVPETRYVYETVQASPLIVSPSIKKQVAAKKSAIYQTRSQVDIKTTQTYSTYEKHREQREVREQTEYQKIQDEHIKCCEIARMSQGIRERIISTYRAEIESHKYLAGDFSGLRAIVEDLRRRKEAMDISINALEGDYEAQVHNQESLIGSLQQELELLKAQNSDKSNESSEISEQTMTIRQEISTRDQSIIQYNSEIRSISSSNQQLEREEENLRHCIGEQHELRQKHQQTILESSSQLSKVEHECNAQGSRVQVLESERSHLIERTNQLQESLNLRVTQIEETNSKIFTAQTDISKLKSMIHGLDIEINEYETANSKLVEEQKIKLQQNSDEYNRAHEYTGQLQSMEAEYYALEVDERGFNTDLEAVNYSNQALMDRNVDLKSEMEALQKHSILLTQQNKDLQKELDSFVETDDIVRRNLDRKEKVTQIRTTVNTALTQSNTMVQQARTPTKSQYGDSFQQERVQSFAGTAGGQRTSYSGAEVRGSSNAFQQQRSSAVSGGLERGGTFEARGGDRVVEQRQEQRQYSDRGGYQAQPRFQARPVVYEQREQRQYNTISQPSYVREEQQQYVRGGQEQVQYVRGSHEQQSYVRGSSGNQQSIGGYRYKTGGSPLRKDSPQREVTREKQQYTATAKTNATSNANVSPSPTAIHVKDESAPVVQTEEKKEEQK